MDENYSQCLLCKYQIRIWVMPCQIYVTMSDLGKRMFTIPHNYLTDRDEIVRTISWPLEHWVCRVHVPGQITTSHTEKETLYLILTLMRSLTLCQSKFIWLMLNKPGISLQLMKW